MISDWIFILGSRNDAFLKTKDNFLISSMSVELRGSFWETTIITSCIHFCGEILIICLFLLSSGSA